MFEISQHTLGILGGGQLGKMLLEVANRWNLETIILDPSLDCPCRNLTGHFQQGDFRDYQTVLEFGKKCTVLTFEIEQVNIDALYELQDKHQVQVYPSPDTLSIIRDKSVQKTFFETHQIPTSPFTSYTYLPQLTTLDTPKFWKKNTMGYDGYGVKKITRVTDLEGLPDSPCLLEDMVSIKRELSVIVCRDTNGILKTYPPVEMIFDPTSNQVTLVTTLIHDSQTHILEKALDVAKRVSNIISHVGLLAVELFQTTQDEIIVNELAPRPHNSGHLTLSYNVSQFEQHLRAILGFPLVDPIFNRSAVMLNINGRLYDNLIRSEYLKSILGLFTNYEVSLYLYGKKVSRTNRKMGHLTILPQHQNTTTTTDTTSMECLLEQVNRLKKLLSNN